MANNLNSNVSAKLLRKFAPGFMSDLVVCKTVDSNLLAGEYDVASGDSVSVKRPHQYQTIETSDGDLSSDLPSNIISAQATAVVQPMISVWIKWSQIEEALKSDQWDKITEPARAVMITTLEKNLASYMLKNAALTSGTIGTAIDAWSDVASMGTYMADLGCTSPVCAILDPWSVQGLADAQKGIASGDPLVKSAWERAQISGNFGGVMPYTSNALSAHTMGTASGAVALAATPVVTYTALKDTYNIALSIDGLGASETITAGTQIEFPATLMLNQQSKEQLVKNGAGIPFTGTVLTDATADGSGVIAVTISGAPIFDATNPQYNVVNRAITDNDVVNILGAASTVYKPSLFYAKDAFGLTTIKLPKLNGWDSSVFSHEGFSLRATQSSDPTSGVQAMRLDLLPAFCTFQPHLAGQGAGY